MSFPEIAYPEIEFKWLERGGRQFQIAVFFCFNIRL